MQGPSELSFAWPSTAAEKLVAAKSHTIVGLPGHRRQGLLLGADRIGEVHELAASIGTGQDERSAYASQVSQPASAGYPQIEPDTAATGKASKEVAIPATHHRK